MTEDDDDLVIESPAHYTITEAIAFCMETALANGQEFFETKICGEDFYMGFIELDDLKETPERVDEAYRRDAFMDFWAQGLAYTLPRQVYQENGALKAYPLEGGACEKLFSTPHAMLDRDALVSLLADVQKQFIDHLFDALKKAAATEERVHVKDLLGLIYHGVIDHIPNSRACLTPERRELLVHAAEKHGLLTVSMKHQYMTAGIGPSSWDMVEHDAILAAAKNSGKLVVQEKPTLN